MSHVHVNILIFQPLLMVFNRDMQDMCAVVNRIMSCSLLVTMVTGMGYMIVKMILFIRDTPNSVVLVN